VKDTAKRAGQQAGNVTTIDILSHLPKSPRLRALDIALSSNPPQDDRAPGIVIFTSGTTGRPKAVVHRRTYTHETATSIGEGYDLGHQDVLLHLLPVHHTTGLGTSFFPFLCAGACIEFSGGGSFDPKWVWDRFLQGGLTVFSAVPTIFLRLKWDFENRIVKLPPSEVARFVTAANQFRLLLSGSSALQDNVQQFWTELRSGTPILTRYGATEFPGCLKVPLDANHKLLSKGCVGLPVPGVELKLSEGTQGELLVKSPYMFAKYVLTPWLLCGVELTYPDISMMRRPPSMRTMKMDGSGQAISPDATAISTPSWVEPRSISSNQAATRYRPQTSNESA
jgi:malonyl-CoA/methylmalonyl-CoA synthetase